MSVPDALRDEAFVKFCQQHVRTSFECEAFIAGWDASKTAQLSVLKFSFMECESCRRKPGSPVLCESCQHNRAMIERATIALVAMIERATIALVKS